LANEREKSQFPQKKSITIFNYFLGGLTTRLRQGYVGQANEHEPWRKQTTTDDTGLGSARALACRWSLSWA